MDEQTQKRRIITRLTTRDLPDPSGLHEPWSTIFSRLRPVTCRSDAVDALRRAAEGLPERETLLRDLVALLPEDPAFCPFPTLLRWIVVHRERRRTCARVNSLEIQELANPPPRPHHALDPRRLALTLPVGASSRAQRSDPQLLARDQFLPCLTGP